MKNKSYYWAILAAASVTILAIVILPYMFSGSNSEEVDSPHTPEELESMRSEAVDYSPQIEAYEELIAANPNDAMAIAGQGDFYMVTGNYTEAVEQYKKALEIDPGNSMFHGSLGEAYFSMGMIEIAIRELETGLQLNPDNQQILLDLGVYYAQSGEDEKAISYWQKAYEINPDNSHGHVAQQLMNQLQNPESTGSAPPLS